MHDIESNPWTDYELLDSGGGNRLERVGNFIISRPAPAALWPVSETPHTWESAQAVYHRSSSGGGNWDSKGLPQEWTIRWENLRFIIKPTGFGHIGLFPEQQPLWRWIMEIVRGQKTPPNVLNLFAYTGSITLAALAAGARVCHVDGSRGVVTWAHENAKLNGFADKPVRWIVDDVLQFAQREIRRGSRYQGIILDPPSFGRGPKGQVWKIERDITPLFETLKNLLSDDASFFLFTCHSSNVSVPGTKNLLANLFQNRGGSIETGNIVIAPKADGPVLPSGIFGRWSKP
jgi:23S rRNA (cytosine1962-C5)-methyltransferase